MFVHVCPTIDVPEVLTYQSKDPLVPDQWKDVLDLVAKTIIDNPQILKVQVAAHTAPAVLSAVGYGESCPMNQGASNKSFTINKRVEFRLLATTSGCTEIPFTCQEAVDLGIIPDEDLKYLPTSDYCQSIKSAP